MFLFLKHGQTSGNFIIILLRIIKFARAFVCHSNLILGLQNLNVIENSEHYHSRIVELSTRPRPRLKSIMFQNLPIMHSGISDYQDTQ